MRELGTSKGLNSWTIDEFEPIAAAIDALFREAGMLR